MIQFTRPLSLLVVLLGTAPLLAGCGTTSRSTVSVAEAPVVTAPQITPVTAQSLEPTPAQNTATAVAAADLSGSIDPAALNLMGAKERADASQAAYWALQFGRPGAPRTWTGPAGSGQVAVGPYVRVNNIDCRDFTHTVTVSGTKYVRKGMACREGSNNWSVVQSSSAA